MFTVDGLEPRAVSAPRTPEEVAQVLKRAAEEGRSVVPRGGGTMDEVGVPFKSLDLLLSLENLNRVLDYQPANLTVRAEAGITLDALNQTLAPRGQYLPLDPPCPERATLGGIVASNASGALRVRYGAARDQLIGLRVALCDGQIVRGGGQVVKNVAGYDLPKLFAGSLGTLGVIVEATFKLVPVPKRTATLVASWSEVAPAVAVAQRVMASSLLPMSVTLLSRGASAQFGVGEHFGLAVRFGSSAPALERSLRDVEQWSREKGSLAGARIDDDAAFWARVRDFSAENKTVVKIGVLPTQIGEIAAAAERIAAQKRLACKWIAHAVGILLLALEGQETTIAEAIIELGDVVSSLKGHQLVARAPRSLREIVDVWGPTWKDPAAAHRAGLGIMQQLKSELDPAGILNPGRFVTG